MTRWMMVLAFCGLMGTLVGCPDEDTEPSNFDCGERGELSQALGEAVCVFEGELVVENGFRCPAGVDTLTTFGPIGICSAGALEPSEVEALASEHRDRNPELWAQAECVGDGECDEGERCENAVCVGEGLCPEGTVQVDSPADCLQDDAICEEVAPGIFCTGPDAPECPEGFEPTDECEVMDEDCFQFSESLLCQRIEAVENCCCEFIIEGDIIEEDLLSLDECGAREEGMCIEVDPDRLTPHPCCPDAQGERCGDE